MGFIAGGSLKAPESLLGPFTDLWLPQVTAIVLLWFKAEHCMTILSSVTLPGDIQQFAVGITNLSLSTVSLRTNWKGSELSPQDDYSLFHHSWGPGDTAPPAEPLRGPPGEKLPFPRLCSHVRCNVMTISDHPGHVSDLEGFQPWRVQPSTSQPVPDRDQLSCLTDPSSGLPSTSPQTSQQGLVCTDQQVIPQPASSLINQFSTQQSQRV